MESRAETIFRSLDSNERFGLQFGLFPKDKCEGITREESVELMKRSTRKE